MLINAITIHLVTKARNLTLVSPLQITFHHFLNHINTISKISIEAIPFCPIAIVLLLLLLLPELLQLSINLFSNHQSSKLTHLSQ